MVKAKAADALTRRRQRRRSWGNDVKRFAFAPEFARRRGGAVEIIRFAAKRMYTCSDEAKMDDTDLNNRPPVFFERNEFWRRSSHRASLGVF